MSEVVQDIILPLEYVGLALPYSIDQSKTYDRQVCLYAIADIEKNSSEAHHAWKTLLVEARFFDVEMSRSLYYHFLLKFPLCHTIRAEWMKMELVRLRLLVNAYQKEKEQKKRDILSQEANGCCRILSHELATFCAGSYNVDMWFLRMVYATLFQPGDILSVTEKDESSITLDAHSSESVEKIFADAAAETTHDPSASKIWHFWIIREMTLNSGNKEEMEKLVERFFEIPLEHSTNPLLSPLQMSFDGVICTAPTSLSELFPSSVEKFEDSLKKHPIHDSYKAIRDEATIPGTKLSLDTNPISAKHWFCIYEEETNTERLKGLAHSLLYENPFSELMVLFACYNFKQLLQPEECITIFQKILQQSSGILRSIVTVLLSNEFALNGSLEKSKAALDDEIANVRKTITDPTKLKESVSVLTMHKMFLLFKEAEKTPTDKSLKPVREAVMQAVKGGVFSWHIFVYLCVLELQWAKKTGNSATAQKMITNVLKQASQHGNTSIDFLHRMVDFLPITQNSADVLVAFEKFVQGFSQDPSSIQPGAIRSVWGRFYQVLKDIVPPWELEAYELRRDRMGFGHGGLVAEKSWSGSGIAQKDEHQDLPLTALQNLVLSSGPAGYLSAVDRYTMPSPDPSIPPMSVISANERKSYDMKHAAWMDMVENDPQVQESLRKIGLREKFGLENDYAKIARTLHAPHVENQKGIQEIDSFVLKPVENL